MSSVQVAIFASIGAFVAGEIVLYLALLFCERRLQREQKRQTLKNYPFLKGKI